MYTEAERKLNKEYRDFYAYVAKLKYKARKRTERLLNTILILGVIYIALGVLILTLR